MTPPRRPGAGSSGQSSQTHVHVTGVRSSPLPTPTPMPTRRRPSPYTAAQRRIDRVRRSEPATGRARKSISCAQSRSPLASRHMFRGRTCPRRRRPRAPRQPVGKAADCWSPARPCRCRAAPVAPAAPPPAGARGEAAVPRLTLQLPRRSKPPPGRWPTRGLRSAPHLGAGDRRRRAGQ